MSYHAATTVVPTNSSDANFRAWGSSVNAKLASMGLVNTADTGQINWTTVTAAAGTNTAQGYEIWRFADTLQATYPVFFKFEYGSGSAVNNPSIWLTVGSGSDGVGGLTGVLSVRRQFTFTATATAITAYWSGDTNRFVFAWQGATTATSLLMAAERTNDGSDLLTNEGVLLTAYSTGAFSQVAWNCTTGPYTVWETTSGALGPEKAPLGTTGAQVAIYPLFHNKGVFLNFGINVMGVVDATIAPNAAFTFTVHSNSHTYIGVGVGAIAGSLQRTTSSLSSVVIRYE